MKNDFSPKTRFLFDMGGYMDSWESGRNDANCLHHILKRCSCSAYNVAPLNNWREHMPEGRKNLPAIHSKEVQKKYLIRTKKFLESIGYKPNQEDLDFLERNKEYYENQNSN